MQTAALRSARVLRQKLTNDPFAYHASDETPLWRKIRRAVVVNPDSSTGNPLPRANRQPEPASRPEKFTVPSSKASDIAQNPYYARDFRRNYPKTEVVTQGELAKLLIAQGGFEALPPVTAAEGEQTTAITADSPAPSLAALYSSSTAVAGSSFRPPTPPGLKFKWKASAEQAPHDPNSYFPMVLFDTTRA
ncbi:uncharacterized protein JCM10292_001432 [Rhodotorula paludigena]|uniref:uncharacterized protein n=1 Tax=Rhodotorula paludigena TaxID=86838 RepID=UPI00316B02B8